MGCASGVKNARLTARLGRDLHVEDGVAAVVVRQLGGEVLEGGALRGEGRGAWGERRGARGARDKERGARSVGRRARRDLLALVLELNKLLVVRDPEDQELRETKTEMEMEMETEIGVRARCVGGGGGCEGEGGCERGWRGGAGAGRYCAGAGTGVSAAPLLCKRPRKTPPGPAPCTPSGLHRSPPRPHPTRGLSPQPSPQPSRSPSPTPFDPALVTRGAGGAAPCRPSGSSSLRRP